jgi:hypothetical protein
MLGTANFPSCQHLLQGFFTKIKYDSKGIKKRYGQMKQYLRQNAFWPFFGKKAVSKTS